MYKVVWNILLQRMIRTLDFHWPHEQTRFGPGYSTTYIGQLQEKANKYISLCFAFFNYEKAFDHIEFESLFDEPKNQGADEAYLNILWNLYSEATSVLWLHKDSEKFNHKEDPDRMKTSLPNPLYHMYNTPSSTRSTGTIKASALTVNSYPTLVLLII